MGKGSSVPSTRHIFSINLNGSSSDSTLKTAERPMTIAEQYWDYSVISEAISGASQNLQIELWIKRDGVTLPTIDTSGDLTYGENQDLLYRAQHGIMRETTGEGSVLHQQHVGKKKRKLKRNDSIVLRFSGSSAMIMLGTLIYRILH